MDREGVRLPRDSVLWCQVLVRSRNSHRRRRPALSNFPTLDFKKNLDLVLLLSSPSLSSLYTSTAMPKIRKKTSNRATTHMRQKVKRKISESHKKAKKIAKKDVTWKSSALPSLPGRASGS
jgi:hypothetical protein